MKGQKETQVERLEDGGFKVFCPSGTILWVDENGGYHRLDGPAMELSYGKQLWWIHGRQLNTKEVATWLETNGIDLRREEDQSLFLVRFS